jgi:hypothetical protein
VFPSIAQKFRETESRHAAPIDMSAHVFQFAGRGWTDFSRNQNDKSDLDLNAGVQPLSDNPLDFSTLLGR